MRADFQRFYGLSLDGLGTEYSVEHAAALIAHMPDDSALYRAIDPAMSWSTTDYLLARLDHDIRLVEWRLAGLASGRRTKQPKPMRTPIDDRPKARARKATKAEMDYVANRLNIPEDRR